MKQDSMAVAEVLYSMDIDQIRCCNFNEKQLLGSVSGETCFFFFFFASGQDNFCKFKFRGNSTFSGVITVRWSVAGPLL